MANDEWTAEELAGIDCALKSVNEPHVVQLSIDRLFFADEDAEMGENLRRAGPILIKLKDEMPEDLRARWQAALGAQLRLSVDRAKKNAKKK